MRKWILALAGLAALGMNAGCGGSSSEASRFAYVLNNPGSLSIVNLGSGITVSGPIALTGNLRNIAVRPTDNKLFAMGTDLKIYEVNPANGNCTVISGAALAVDGHNGGMTFEPNSTVIRFVSINDNNYRIDSTNGTLLGTDTDSNHPAVGLALRTNPSPEYFMYAQTDEIYTSTNVAGGVFTLVGPSGEDLSGGCGMAIDNETGKAYVVSSEGLFRANLTTGDLSQINSTSADDIAIVP